MLSRTARSGAQPPARRVAWMSWFGHLDGVLLGLHMAERAEQQSLRRVVAILRRDVPSADVMDFPALRVQRNRSLAAAAAESTYTLVSRPDSRAHRRQLLRVVL